MTLSLESVGGRLGKPALLPALLLAFGIDLPWRDHYSFELLVAWEGLLKQRGGRESVLSRPSFLFGPKVSISLCLATLL